MSGIGPTMMTVIRMRQLTDREIAFSIARAHLRSRNNPQSILPSMRHLHAVMTNHNKNDDLAAPLDQLAGIIRIAEAMLAAKSAAELHTHERELIVLQRSFGDRGYRSTLTAIKKITQLCGYMHMMFTQEAYSAENATLAPAA